MKYLRSYKLFENNAEIDDALTTVGDALQDIFDEYSITDISSPDRAEDIIYYTLSDDKKHWQYNLNTPEANIENLKKLIENPDSFEDDGPYYKKSIEISNITKDIVFKIGSDIPRLESMCGHKLKVSIEEAQDMSWLHQDQITRTGYPVAREKTYDVIISVKD